MDHESGGAVGDANNRFEEMNDKGSVQFAKEKLS